MCPLQNALDYNGMFRFVVALFVKFHSLLDLVWCFNILNSLVLLGGLKQRLFVPQHLLYLENMIRIKINGIYHVDKQNEHLVYSKIKPHYIVDSFV